MAARADSFTAGGHEQRRPGVAGQRESVREAVSVSLFAGYIVGQRNTLSRRAHAEYRLR